MKTTSSDHIVVTGATGFLGSHLMPVLKSQYPANRLTGLSSQDYDLLDPAQTKRMFAELKPDILIHLAAYSGGIEANRKKQADFFHINLILMENVFHEAALNHVKKLVYPMGGCSYPGDATSPIGEAQMWKGFPVETSAGYSSAKKMGIVAGFAYRSQYGLASSIVVPGNMYGEHDNYIDGESHVIPGLIRRFHEAKLACRPAVAMWGTGKPTRDFVHAGDVAACFPYFIENDEPGPVNISSGARTSIRELSEKIAALTGYAGKLEWDESKPDGQLHKIFDVTKLKSLGLSCPTSLDAGLERTIRWFAANYDKPGAVRLAPK